MPAAINDLRYDCCNKRNQDKIVGNRKNSTVSPTNQRIWRSAAILFYGSTHRLFRTGCCDADAEDIGKHFVCARVDDVFLQYSLSQGNDLITPRLEFGFAGLSAGDQWCVCA